MPYDSNLDEYGNWVGTGPEAEPPTQYLDEDGNWIGTGPTEDQGKETAEPEESEPTPEPEPEAEAPAPEDPPAEPPF